MLLFIFTGQQYVLLQYKIYQYICAKMYIFNNKCWGRGLWAWSDFPSFLSLANHMPDFGDDSAKILHTGSARVKIIVANKTCNVLGTY